MKVQLETCKDLKEPEIIIRCSEVNKKIENIQKMLLESTLDYPNISLYQENKECYLPLEEILFFETELNCVFAHSRNDVYKVKYKLYELERLLPKQFIRVSKSTVLNIEQVFSIDRNLTSYSLIQFYNSHKKVYVSRLYYKTLKHKLEERRTL